MSKLPPLLVNPPFKTENSLAWNANYKSTYQRAYQWPSHNNFVKEVAEAKRIKLGALKMQGQTSVIPDDPLNKKCYPHKKLKPLRKHQHQELENTGLLLSIPVPVVV